MIKGVKNSTRLPMEVEFCKVLFLLLPKDYPEFEDTAMLNNHA